MHPRINDATANDEYAHFIFIFDMLPSPMLADDIRSVFEANEVIAPPPLELPEALLCNVNVPSAELALNETVTSPPDEEATKISSLALLHITAAS